MQQLSNGYMVSCLWWRIVDFTFLMHSSLHSYKRKLNERFSTVEPWGHDFRWGVFYISWKLLITPVLCVVYPAPVFQFPLRNGERVTQMMYRQTCFVFRALRQKPPDRPPPSGFCWSLCRLTTNMTLIWKSRAGVCCNSQTLTCIHITRPGLITSVCPWSKDLFWKTKPLPCHHGALQHFPSASPFFRFSFAVLLSSSSLGDCFSSTCSCQISVSCSPVCCEQVDQETWPQRQWWRSMRSWWGRIPVSVTLSLSLLYLCLSLSGTWVSVTVGRCWHMEEPRSPCWWWKVTSTFCFTFFFPKYWKNLFTFTHKSQRNT